ncbi:MAG TPA: hypothetical protein PK869_17065, partial [Candidatus Hydrogenedentes bacterium]|nr:hypothetical protein [Candidatus Hydrogenedentota bacterium]
MTATKKNIPAFIPALVVGLLAFALFAPTIPYGFTGYDDNDYVTDNPYVQRGISGESIVWAFTTGHAANWHPITWLSHAFDWQISGKNPWMHHATNVCLHAVNAALLFLLLYRCTGALWPSFFVAALFAVHPLNVQSVAWVAERKNVLSTFFGLLSLLAYARYSRTKSAPAYAASLALLACGLMSKPMLVTWPFVMLLMDYWPLQRIAAPIRDFKQVVRQVLKLTPEKVPYFALVFVSSVVTYLVQSRAGATGGEGGIPILYRCLNAIVSYAAYLWQTVWPFGLAAFYPHPFDTIAMWKVVLSLFLLLAITALVLRYGSTKRYLVFGWF